MRHPFRETIGSGIALAIQVALTAAAWTAVDRQTQDWDNRLLASAAGDVLVVLAASIAIVACREFLLLRATISLRYQTMYEDGRPGDMLNGPRETIQLALGEEWRGIVMVSFVAPSALAKYVARHIQRNEWVLEIRYVPSSGYVVHHELVRSLTKTRLSDGSQGVRFLLKDLGRSREGGRYELLIRPELQLGAQPIDMQFSVARQNGKRRGMGWGVRVDSAVSWHDFRRA